MFGLINDGFRPMRLDDIEALIKELLTERFLNIDTSAESVVGQLVGISAKLHADEWEQMDNVYINQHPSEAIGIHLDYILEYNGLIRLDALSTVVKVGFKGTKNTAISEGSQVRSAVSNDLFTTINDDIITDEARLLMYVRIDTAEDSSTYDLTIDSTLYQVITGIGVTVEDIALSFVSGINADPTAVVIAYHQGNGDIKLIAKTTVFDTTVESRMSYFTPIECESIEKGSIPATEDSITIIETPISGLSEVNNFEEGTQGRNTETDAEARIRRINSLQIAGAGTLPAIVARMLDDVAGVIQVKGFENREDTIDGDGRPPHSFEIVIEGGSDEDIGNQLWLTKPAGIQTFGNTHYDITDSNGDLQRMFFSRPVSKYAWIKATLTLYDEEIYPVDGDDQVAQQILDYGNTLNIGEDIIPQRLHGPIFQVPGIETILVEIATTDTPGGTPVYQTTTIEIEDNQIAVFALSRITVISP